MTSTCGIWYTMYGPVNLSLHVSTEASHRLLPSRRDVHRRLGMVHHTGSHQWSPGIFFIIPLLRRTCALEGMEITISKEELLELQQRGGEQGCPRSPSLLRPECTLAPEQSPRPVQATVPTPVPAPVSEQGIPTWTGQCHRFVQVNARGKMKTPVDILVKCLKETLNWNACFNVRRQADGMLDH